MVATVELQESSIGALSRAAGVKIETIRYYEKAGAMPRPLRGPGGHRVYSHADLRRLSFIRRARELGFGLDEIRHMLSLVDDGTLTCDDIYAITTQHLTAVRMKIADLQRLATALDGMASACSRGKVPACPIIDTLFDDT